MGSGVPLYGDFRVGSVRQCRWIGWAFIAFFLSFFSISAAAASFDCKKAKTSFEKLVCSDHELSRLDDELALTYKKALVASSHKDRLKDVQRAWLALARNKLTDVSSLTLGYKKQIAYLRGSPFRWSRQVLARERNFAERSLIEKLDCKAEATNFVGSMPDDSDGAMWRNALYLECLTGLLTSKQFNQVKQQIKVLDGNPQIWGTRLLPRLGLIPNIVIHGVENAESSLISFECQSETPYGDPELADLVRVLLTRIDLNDDEPTTKAGSEFRFLGVFLNVISDTGCLERDYSVRLYNLLLDHGLKTTYWRELNDGLAGPASYDSRNLSGLMLLGDEGLVRRILKGGISANPDTAMSLVLHAPTMRMVSVLEEYGFRITKEQANQALKYINDQRSNNGDGEKSGPFNRPLELDGAIISFIEAATK